MNGWHRGAMAAFDLETDGPDPEDARIVTACVAEIDGTGTRKPNITTWVLKPTRPIPDEAAEIHGYTTDRAQAEGADPTQGVRGIAILLGQYTQAGLPIVAFNASYDFTVLDRELRRHGVGMMKPGPMRVIDPFVLDKHVDRYRKGKRTLTAACEHYRVRLDGAHDSSHDALAAARVAWAIAHRNPAIARLGLDELHALQVTAKSEQDHSFAAYLRRLAANAGGVDEQLELHAKAKRVESQAGGWPVAPVEPQGTLT